MLRLARAGTLLALLVAAEHHLDSAVVALPAGSVEEVTAKSHEHLDV